MASTRRKSERQLTKSRAQSALTNGTILLPMVDGRSAGMRRFKDLLNELLDDLGGAQGLSLAEYELAKCAALQMFLAGQYGGQLLCEIEEDGTLSKFKAKRLTRTTTALTRIFRLLGVKRRRAKIKTILPQAEVEKRLRDSGIKGDDVITLHKQLERGGAYAD